jgi:hypothetical protein
LIARDGGGVWRGCDRPPSWCEAHHLDEWIRDDGPTDLINLALLCSRNHHDAHEGGRSLAQDEQCTWQVKLGLPPPSEFRRHKRVVAGTSSAVAGHLMTVWTTISES